MSVFILLLILVIIFGTCSIIGLLIIFFDKQIKEEFKRDNLKNKYIIVLHSWFVDSKKWKVVNSKATSYKEAEDES